MVQEWWEWREGGGEGEGGVEKGRGGVEKSKGWGRGGDSRVYLLKSLRINI